MHGTLLLIILGILKKLENVSMDKNIIIKRKDFPDTHIPKTAKKVIGTNWNLWLVNIE